MLMQWKIKPDWDMLNLQIISPVTLKVLHYGKVLKRLGKCCWILFLNLSANFREEQGLIDEVILWKNLTLAVQSIPLVDNDIF